MRIKRPKTDTRTKWEYFIVLLMFLVSGTSFFYMQNGRYFVSLYFICSFCFLFKYGTNYKRDFASKFFFVFFLVWVSINFFVINSNHHPDYAIQYYLYILLIIPSFYVITSFEYNKFKRIALNIGFVMAGISMIIFFLVENQIFTTSNDGPFMMFLFHNMGWRTELFGRLAGMYWEPGAYAIILNTIILLYLNDIANHRLLLDEKKKLAVIFLALVLTKSTAGYMSLIGILAIYAISSKYIQNRPIIGILGILVVGFLSIILYNSDVIQNKLSQRGHSGTSYEVRLADNLAMIQMTKEEPFWGYGVGSKNLIKRGSQLGNVTSSNGILDMSSKFGIPFIAIYCIVLLLQLKRYYCKKSILVFPLILFLYSFEVFFYFPLAYLFLFRLRSSQVC